MTAPGNNVVIFLLALALVVASAYASGRIHQWYRNGLERDQAYRDGYDQASHSLFDMATHKRSAKDRQSGISTVSPIPGGRSGSVGVLRRRIFTSAGRKSDRARGRHSAA